MSDPFENEVNYEQDGWTVTVRPEHMSPLGETYTVSARKHSRVLYLPRMTRSDVLEFQPGPRWALGVLDVMQAREGR